jgi:hypothetical protein
MNWRRLEKESQGGSGMNEHPINRVSAFIPIFMSIFALLAVAHSYRHASHEDGSWHIWMLMVFLQLPLACYFVITSRREFRRVIPILATQAALWIVILVAGAYQQAWS